MSKPNLLLFIAVACIWISVLGEKGTHGKSISSVFRRSVGFIFCILFWDGRNASRERGVWHRGRCANCIQCRSARWDDLFRKGIRRLVRYVFRRNAPSNPQK